MAKTHVMGIREGEDSMLQRCWTHGHSLSKQTQVLVAKTHVLGMRERASLYASEVLDAWSQFVKSKHKCWWQRHMSWACERQVSIASELNSMVKSDNRSCLMAIPVFFTSPEGYKIEVNAAIAGVKGG